MWDRVILKRKAKEAFTSNYWKTILVALICSIVVGGGASSSVSGAVSSSSSALLGGVSYDSGNDVYYDYEDDDDYEDYDNYITIEPSSELPDGFWPAVGIMFGVVSLMMLAIFAVIAVFSLAVKAFFFNPLEIGCKRYFHRNLYSPAKMGDLLSSFDREYLNQVKIMFFRDIKLIGWTLLFVIPGIIKSYEYMMVPYILSENPGISSQEAFGLSKQMMDGQKWKTFVLDLSFLGWNILSIFTCGILSIFYVNPYHYSAHAAVYDATKLAQNSGSAGGFGPEGSFENAM